MAAPAYYFTNYFYSGEPAADLTTYIETQLTSAGWVFVEQQTFTQASTARQMRVWRCPAAQNVNGVDFYIGLVRNTATGQGYFAVRTFETWNSTAKTIQMPTFNSSGSLLAYPSSITYANGQFLATIGSVFNSSSTWYSSNAATSTDGITWTSRRLPVTSNWSSAAYGNGTWVAVSGGFFAQGSYFSNVNSIAASSTDNGVTWTQRTLPSSSGWSAVTYGSGPALFVAVSLTSGTTAASSPDGITWTARTLPTSAQWTSVAYGNGTYVAVSGVTSSTAAASSTTGTTWTARTLPTSTTWSSVTYGAGPGLFVAVGSGAVATSPDGITWTSRTAVGAPIWVTYDSTNARFVTVGMQSSPSSQQISYSSDGITWTLGGNNGANYVPGTYTAGLAYGNGTYATVSGSGVATTSASSFTDPILGTPVARAIGAISASGLGDYPLANIGTTTAPTQGTVQPIPGFSEASVTLGTATSFDIAILASKSYLAVAVNTNGTATQLFSAFAGAYAPAYSDTLTSNPALALLSAGTGGVTRSMRAPLDASNFTFAALATPDALLLGTHTSATKEAVTQSIRGSRAALIAGSGTVGFTTIGSFRGWLYDCILVAISGTNLKVADTVTLGGTTYTALGQATNAQLYSGTINYGLFFNTAGGS